MKIYCCHNCLEKNRVKIKSYQDYFKSLIKYKTFESEKENFIGFGLENKINDGKCIFCNSEVELLNIENDELTTISMYGSPNPDYILAMNKLKGDNIILFTTEYNKLVEIQNQQKAKNLARQTEIEREQNTVRCPRCGSTQITTGQRGYSFLTGFLGSNKTVNRCAKCGYSWKPGK